MSNTLISLAALLFMVLAKAVATTRATGPFLDQVDKSTWIFGNDVWNLTQGKIYGTKLWYKERDCVREAVGHYVSYNVTDAVLGATEVVVGIVYAGPGDLVFENNGAAANLNWTEASIVKQGNYNGKDFVDLRFTANEGELHWVIFSGQHGAYQYFVNQALPTLGEFRTLWRLDNTTFTWGKTLEKDAILPPLDLYFPQNKVQDETWLMPNGTGYITKYDFTSWVRSQKYYGVYGPDTGFGSWYINAGKDYYNGDQTKQELMVHRESSTGDVVQLNMVHGTHFMVSASDAFPPGKIWGPWLWYLNDGSKTDAAAQADREFAAWPYAWLDDEAYHTRGNVSGQLRLSDGRPAANAAIFLGDNKPNKTSLDMGSTYYYTTYADGEGRFAFVNVRNATYGLQAWSNGGAIGDVTTTYAGNDVVVPPNKETRLGELRWTISNKAKIFQVGDFDRYSYGFLHGGVPYQHGLVAECPADLNFTIGSSKTTEWCFGQTYQGNWTVSFKVPYGADPSTFAGTRNATLIVSLAGYSSGTSSTVWANGDKKIGNLTSGTAELLSDPSLYRSATAAGEWRQMEFDFDASILRQGWNTLTFQVTKNTTWHGFMWDAIKLEW